MRNVIDYVDGTTFLHRLNPVAKLGLAAAIVLATVLATSYSLLIGLIALTVMLAVGSGAGARLVAALKLIAPLAAVMFALQVAFTRTGIPVWGPITDAGIASASRAWLRLIGIAMPLIVMLAITRLTDLADACVEILHVPYPYAFTFTTALRFVPVFTREMNAIMEAQTARGVRFDTANPLRRLRLMLPVCIPLLVTSVAKTDATALAAEQRGFYLRDRTSSYRRFPLRARDACALACAAALVVLGVAL